VEQRGRRQRLRSAKTTLLRHDETLGAPLRRTGRPQSWTRAAPGAVARARGVPHQLITARAEGGQRAIVGRERRGDETFADETFVTEIVAADHSGPVHSAPTSAAGLVTSQGTSDGVVGAAASVVSCALRSSASARWTSPVL